MKKILVQAELVIMALVFGMMTLSSCGGENVSKSSAIVASGNSETTANVTKMPTQTVNITNKNGETVTDKNGQVKTEIITKTSDKGTVSVKKQSTCKPLKTAKKTAQKITTADTQKKYTVDTIIELSDGNTKAKGVNSGFVKTSGSVVTIAKKGVYELSGELRNGQLRIDLASENANYKKSGDDKVVLVLNGVKITNSNGFAVYVDCAKTTVFNSKKNTTSVFKDGGIKGETKAWACIYSDDDITFNGEGSTEVYGNTNNGIYSRNEIKINGGNLKAYALKNAIRGDEKVEIKGGFVDATTEQGDCIKATYVNYVTQNGKKSLDKKIGCIIISGGKLSLKAGDDGLQAISLIEINKSATVTVVYKGKYSGAEKGKKTNTGYTDEITGISYDGEVIGKEYIL